MIKGRLHRIAGAARFGAELPRCRRDLRLVNYMATTHVQL
jgi:hypothetical protein